jgi:prophage endopeptidase
VKLNLVALIVVALALLSGLLYLSNLRSEASLLRANLSGANQQIADLQAAGARYEQAIKARDSVDQQFTQELANAKAENDSLRASVDAGRKRLLIKANCPALRAGTGASPASLAYAGAAELDPSARQDYHDLRSRLTTTEKTLAGLQAYVAQVCLKR